jgi:hypothetical protein
LAFYLSAGLLLARSEKEPLAHDDLFFQFDPRRVVNDFASDDMGIRRMRTKVHPIFVILFHPISSTIVRTTGVSPVTVTVFANSFAGALGFLGAFLIFHQIGRRFFVSIMLALLFAFSTSQILISVIPESWVFSSLSLLLTYYMFFTHLYRRKIPYWLWVVAGIFSFGLLVTNFVQTFLFYAIVEWRETKVLFGFKKYVMKLIVYAAWVVGLVAALALLQRLIYPNTGLFLSPAAILKETFWISLLVFEKPLLVVGELVKNFFVFNIVSPTPRILELKEGLPVLTFSMVWSFSKIGLVVLSSWGLLAVAGKKLDEYKKHKSFYIGLLGSLVFLLLMHSFYGVRNEQAIELFIYSGSLNFLVIAVFLANYFDQPSRFEVAGLTVFVASLAINNVFILREALLLYL